MRQRGPSGQTFTRIIRNEYAEAAWAAVTHHVVRSAAVFADEHSSYDDLDGLNPLRCVNHATAHQADEGANTNQVFFSRAERSYVGVHHRMSTRYLDWYMADLAWRDDSLGWPQAAIYADGSYAARLTG